MKFTIFTVFSTYYCCILASLSSSVWRTPFLEVCWLFVSFMTCNLCWSSVCHHLSLIFSVSYHWFLCYYSVDCLEISNLLISVSLLIRSLTSAILTLQLMCRCSATPLFGGNQVGLFAAVGNHPIYDAGIWTHNLQNTSLLS